MNVEPYTVDHFRELAGVQPDGTACLNAVAGPAFALLEGSTVVAIGGVRVQGIGQAWAMLGPDSKGHSKTILRTAREVMAHSIAQEHLYRVYAEATVDKPAWFKHLGFIQQGNILVR